MNKPERLTSGMGIDRLYPQSMGWQRPIMQHRQWNYVRISHSEVRDHPDKISSIAESHATASRCTGFARAHVFLDNCEKDLKSEFPRFTVQFRVSCKEEY